MLKKLLWSLFGIILMVPIVGGLAGVKLEQFKVMGEGAALMVVPPERVTTVDVKQEEWQPRVFSVGSLMAVQGTIVSTEAEGTVREIKFEAGTDVQAGDMLVQLDVDIEQAQLRDAQATAELSNVSYTRAKQLIGSQSISQAEFDTAAVNLKQSLAKIDNIKALIAKKKVIAPFAGKLGIRKISVGQFLQKGAEVVSLQSLDPVYADFSLPQQKLGIISTGLAVEVTTDAYPGETFQGKITAINPDIDQTTKNVRVQATLDNKDGRLRPGMFASVNVVLAKKETVMFVPETAVQHAPFGDSVFVVDEQTTTTAKGETTTTLVAKQQFVRLGDRHGDFVVAKEGLKPGDKIVTTGVFKLQPGMTLEIDNTLAPKFELNPDPENT